MAVRQTLTYEDLAGFPDDGLRRELISGELHVTPSPMTRHQRVVMQIAGPLHSHITKYGGGEVFVAPLDVVFSPRDVVEPDVIAVSEADADIVGEKNIQGPPTLVVEVLSDPLRDRGLKRKLYEQFKVQEYWIADPESNSIEIYKLAGERYEGPTVLTGTGSLTLQWLPGFKLDVDEVFR